MTVSCPECGSRYLRVSRRRTLREKLRDLVGISPLRCGDCGTRFVARTWNLSIFHSQRLSEGSCGSRHAANPGTQVLGFPRGTQRLHRLVESRVPAAFQLLAREEGHTNVRRHTRPVKSFAVLGQVNLIGQA